MTTLSSSLKFFLNLAKVHTVMSRSFDARLNGLGLSDFMILYHLSLAKDEKLRRIDLADKIGLTASGVTRLLAPMEKIGLIKKEANQHDARVSYVVLAAGGKRKLEETLENAEALAKDVLSSIPSGKMKDAQEVMIELSSRVL